jgi:hypothetical protein
VDDTRDRGLSRPLKAGLAALALGGLLAIVALAARGAHPGGGGRLHQREVPAWVANDLLTIAIVAYTFAAITLVVVLLLVRDKWAPPKNRMMRRLAGLIVLMAAVAFLGYQAENGLWSKRGRGGGQQQTQVTNTRRTPTLPARPVADRPARFDWIFAAAMGGGLLLVAAMVLARRRDGAADEEEESVEEDLSAVVSDTIDDLRSEGDPRRAVIAAYARMERVLAQHGQPRHVSEAPFEYLARVLLKLRVRAAAVRELTELFEHAKFSTHEIDDPMKERAIAALVSIRDDLRTAPA